MNNIAKEFKGVTNKDIRIYIRNSGWDLEKAKTKKELFEIILNNRARRQSKSFDLDSMTGINLKKECRRLGICPKSYNKKKKSELIDMIKSYDNSKELFEDGNAAENEIKSLRSSFKRKGYKKETRTIIFSTPDDTFLPGISSTLSAGDTLTLRHLIDKRREINIPMVSKYAINNNPIYLDDINLNVEKISNFVLQPGTKHIRFKYNDRSIGSYPFWEWAGIINKVNKHYNDNIYIILLKYWGIDISTLSSDTVVELFVLLTYCDTINHGAAAKSNEFKVISKITLDEIAVICNHDYTLRHSILLMSLLSGTLLCPRYVVTDENTIFSINTSLAITRAVHIYNELFNFMEGGSSRYYDLTSPKFIYNTSTIPKRENTLSILNPESYYPNSVGINGTIKKLGINIFEHSLRYRDEYLRKHFK